MNEEANFCSQCGAKVSPGAKFCSNCGYVLQSSSTQTPLDKTIKVEVTNATVEKGFETVGKGVKATGATLKKGVKATGEIINELTNKYKEHEEAQKKTKTSKKVAIDYFGFVVILIILLSVFILFQIFKSSF